MHFRILILLSDFSTSSIQFKEASYQELIFSKHILFSIIYLLQEQKLNYRNYIEQEKIMNIFV
jgi:hypothetical protein